MLEVCRFTPRAFHALELPVADALRARLLIAQAIARYYEEDAGDAVRTLVREAATLVTLCREKIHAAEVQVRTITEQLER